MYDLTINDDRFAAKYGDCKIDTWVTLGAPLGDNYIRKRLLGADGEPVGFIADALNESEGGGCARDQHGLAAAGFKDLLQSLC